MRNKNNKIQILCRKILNENENLCIEKDNSIYIIQNQRCCQEMVNFILFFVIDGLE